MATTNKLPEGSTWDKFVVENVTSDVTISVTFAADTNDNGIPDKYENFNVAAVAGEGGSAAPANQIITFGNDATVTITPEPGMAVDTITIGDTTYINDPEYVENVAIDGIEYNTIEDAIDAATNGSTILVGKDVTETLQIPAGKSFTLDAKGHKITGAVRLNATESGDVDITIKRATIEGNTSNTYGITSQNQTDTAGINNCSVTLENCTLDNFSAKGIYLTNAKSLVLKDCVFTNCSSAPMGDPNTKGDYVVDLNLVNAQDVDVQIIDCTFQDNAAQKAVIKIAARGGESDADATDIPKVAESTVSNVLIQNCSFKNNEAENDFNIGTTSKTAGDVENTTGTYPVTISNTATAMSVCQPYNNLIIELDAGESASKTSEGNIGMPIIASDSDTFIHAAGNAKYNHITLGANIDIASTLNFSHACTLDGSSNTVNANVQNKVFNFTQPTDIENITISNTADATEWKSIHGAQLYGAQYNVKNATFTGNNAGIYINSAEVTLEGTINVSNNTFGGIGLGKSSAEGSAVPVLNINGATIVNTSEEYGKPTIWIDGNTDDDGIVNGADNFTLAIINNQKQYYLDPDNINSVLIDGVAYDSIEDAINAVPDNIATELSCYADMIVPTEIVIAENKIVTLNLNGHTLTDSDQEGRVITNNGKLTITGNGTITGTRSGAITNNGTLIIENGTFNGAENINGASINNTATGNLTVNGGTFNGCPRGIQNLGTLVIEDGTFYGTNSYTGSNEGNGVVCANGANTTINGGTFIGQLNGFSAIDNGNCTTTINGGTFSSNGAENSGAIYNGIGNNITITDCTASTSGESGCTIVNKGHAIISKGTFTGDNCYAQCYTMDSGQGASANSTLELGEDVVVTGTFGALRCTSGTMTVKGGSYSVVDCDNHEATPYYALFVSSSSGNVNVVIENGNFESLNTCVRCGESLFSSECNLTIENGTFTSPSNIPCIVEGEPGNIEITGGNYSTNVQEFVTGDHSVVEQDGRFIVQ